MPTATAGNVYDYGSRIDFWNTFGDNENNDVPIDPYEICFTFDIGGTGQTFMFYKNGSPVSTSWNGINLSIGKSATGIYYCFVDTTPRSLSPSAITGIWRYAWGAKDTPGGNSGPGLIWPEPQELTVQAPTLPAPGTWN